MKERRVVWLFLCIQCALHSSFIVVVCSTVQNACSINPPRHPLKGRFFQGFFVNSTEHFAARFAPSVYGCRAACEQTDNCLVMSFNSSIEDANNCKLFNSTRFHWNLEKDNSSFAILITPPGCNEKSVVDGGWSEWVNISDWRVVRSFLLVRQERSCDSPSPVCNGRLCSGHMTREVNVSTTAWTTVQRRMSGSVEFYRGWKEYKKGFGDLSGEFWLGLDNIHALTQSGQYNLRFDLWDDQEHRFAEYEEVTVSNEADNYRLDYASYDGTAGDAMTARSKGRPFSTYDQDNDEQHAENCAERWEGAWWYGGCHYANLNGLYMNGTTTLLGGGMVWHPFRGWFYSLLRTEINVKRIR